MKVKPNLLLSLLAVSALGTASSQAALLLHSSMDNADVGAGAGADTTAAGTFSVGNNIGAAGTAGANAHTTPIATTTTHITSGATGQIGAALSFPGTENAGVRYSGVAAPGTGDYTVSLWFNFNSSAQNGILAGSGNAGSGNEGWTIFHENGKLIYRLSVNGAGNDLRAAVNADIANDSNWHHAALIIDSTAGVVQGYLDGTAATGTGLGGPPDGTFVTDGNGIANSDPIILGSRSNGGFQFRGDLDDVAIWDEALNSTAVNQIYQNGLNGIAVPEPSALLMLGIAGLSTLLRRRR